MASTAAGSAPLAARLSGRESEPRWQISSKGRFRSFSRETSKRHHILLKGLISSSNTMTAPLSACASAALNALFGILPDLVSHSVLVERKETNPKDHRFGRILANALETHLGPTLQCCHRLTEEVAPEMWHKAVDNEPMCVDEFGERRFVRCWRHGAQSILITSWTVAGSWHGSHHIAVHGVEVGCLAELLLLLDGIRMFQVESFALRRQPTGVDEQLLQVLQLPQRHAS